MDGAILVVAATDGTMPQTREHMLLAKQVLPYFAILVHLCTVELDIEDTVAELTDKTFLDRKECVIQHVCITCP